MCPRRTPRLYQYSARSASFSFRKSRRLAPLPPGRPEPSPKNFMISLIVLFKDSERPVTRSRLAIDPPPTVNVNPPATPRKFINIRELVSIPNMECRAVFRLALAPVVEAGSGHIGMAEPNLHLGDVRLIGKRIGWTQRPFTSTSMPV